MPDRRFDMFPPAPWPSGPRPASAEARASSVLAALTQAARLARTGDLRGARTLCAEIVLDAQPLIAARKELLRGALHALLLAQGFKLLARLVMAMSGHSVQVILLPEAAGPIAPPRVRQEARYTTYLLDPRWMAQLAPDDMFLRQWCDALIAYEPDRPVPVAPEPAARHLEPV